MLLLVLLNVATVLTLLKVAAIVTPGAIIVAVVNSYIKCCCICCRGPERHVDVSKMGKWKHDLFDVLCSRVESGDTRVRGALKSRGILGKGTTIFGKEGLGK